MITRALLEAHVKNNKDILNILESAGVVLTEGAVYWAIKDHNYDTVNYVVKYLKGKDLLGVESLDLPWGIDLAMPNDDERIYELLKAEGCIISSK